MKYPKVLASVTQRRAYSVEEAAGLYSVSKGFLRARIREGTLPAKRAGRRVLLLNPDLVAFFEGKKS